MNALTRHGVVTRNATRRVFGAGAAMFAIAGCQMPAFSVEPPALLSAPTPQCHAQIESVIGSLLGAPVSLGQNVFLDDANVLIEHRHARDAAGHFLDGRLLGRPEKYRLVRAEGKCTIIDERKSERVELTACTCQER